MEKRHFFKQNLFFLTTSVQFVRLVVIVITPSQFQFNIMQKVLLFLTFTAFTLALNAQSTTYKAFKVDLGIGYAIPTASGSGTKAGVTFTLHPHYRLTDDLALGLRFEGAALGYKRQSGDNVDIKLSVLTSYCATGEYYLSQNNFRPFVGAGLGVFTRSAEVHADNINGGEVNSTKSSGSNFGFFPELGFEAGHFRMSADYDIVGGNGSYFAIKIGVFFGGGKK